MSIGQSTKSESESERNSDFFRFRFRLLWVDPKGYLTDPNCFMTTRRQHNDQKMKVLKTDAEFGVKN